MKKTGVLEQLLCGRWCGYYKPGKNEELACRGYDVVQHLQSNHRIRIDVPVSETQPHQTIVAALRHRMCGGCSFFSEDCDFILTGGTAAPCGGFRLLMRLIEMNMISIDDVMI
jgi:hypothetical protein